jgi:hypothetical protein
MHDLPCWLFQRSDRNCQTDVQRVYPRKIFNVESVFVVTPVAAVVLQKLLVGVLQ